ncbi:hypothetical protein E3E35_03440 [Thermococcus sp. GR7]|uniref:hypothetical protein n=1 Tax=unclassified Thermococcus TaxID=2627626 RepID=UPI00142F6999|nr:MULTISPECIES: hypothetical protein [unclassified Thermococcus]NJE46483.1 hypothetical protein [Thermococcus sp. GR7]NJE77597.1 hypothetical protein [Thermococcus sp. GR4]NJF23686.1 hypothetical protein [Thermococcus sp. GR5]
MKKSWKIVAVSLVLLSLLFYFGNFTLAKSETHSGTQVGATRSANATFNEGFCVYSDSAFGKFVVKELKARGYRILPLSTPVECDGQFLAVWVEGVNISYTLVKARGSVKAVAVYSSLGRPKHYLEYLNATDKRKALITFVSDIPGEVQAYTIVTITDDSKGILGLRGYEDYLLRQTAKALVDAVENLRGTGE